MEAATPLASASGPRPRRRGGRTALAGRASLRCTCLQALALLANARVDYQLHGQLCYRYRERSNTGEVLETPQWPSSHGQCLPWYDLIEMCFDGMGYTHCNVIGGMPDLAHSNVDSELIVGQGVPFCVECCSNSRPGFFFKETWNLECPVAPQPDIDTNVYEHVFRFMRRRTLEDKRFVECKVPRMPEVQRIVTSYKKETDGTFTNISGAFGIGFSGYDSDPINWNAVAQEWEEMRLRTEPGTGFEESMEQKIEGVIARFECNATDPPEFQEWTRKYTEAYIMVPRSQVVDAADTGEGDTFLWTEEQLAELVTVDNFAPRQMRVTRHGPYDPDGNDCKPASGGCGAFTWSITFPENVYNVPLMVPNTDGFEGNVVVEPVNPNPLDPDASLFLHGYHLQIEVTEQVYGAEVWKGVEYCKVNTTERPGPPEMFYQSITVMKSSGTLLRPGVASVAATLSLTALLLAPMVTAEGVCGGVGGGKSVEGDEAGAWRQPWR